MHTGAEHRSQSASVKAKLTSGVSSPPQNTLPTTNEALPVGVEERMSAAEGRRSAGKDEQPFKGAVPSVCF